MDVISPPLLSSPLIRNRLQNHQHQPAFTLASTPPACCRHLLRHFPKSKARDPWGKRLQSYAVCKSKKLRVCCSQVEVEQDSISDEDDTEQEACELVNGTELTIEVDKDVDDTGGIHAYLFKAVKNNNATGILLLSDILGFQDSSTRDFAYRVACGGYNVLVPDLFNGDSWSKDRPSDLLQQWVSGQRPERIAEIVSSSAKWMINEFESVGISKKLGIIGFCFGGGRVVDILAQDQGAYFGCGVSFYGTRIDARGATKVNVPLLLITGEYDSFCPVSILEEMAQRNKELKMVVFQGRDHGFAHRPKTVEEDVDAEEAFTLMRDWLANGLLAKV